MFCFECRDTLRLSVAICKIGIKEYEVQGKCIATIILFMQKKYLENLTEDTKT